VLKTGFYNVADIDSEWRGAVVESRNPKTRMLGDRDAKHLIGESRRRLNAAADVARERRRFYETNAPSPIVTSIFPSPMTGSPLVAPRQAQ
jgi:hypothetical protein